MAELIGGSQLALNKRRFAKPEGKHLSLAGWS